MPRNRLQLVVPENGTTGATDAPKELPATATSPDALMGHLCLVRAHEESPPDDAA